jgi:hypothetical protein
MTFSTSTLCHWRIQSLDRILQIAQFRGHACIQFVLDSNGLTRRFSPQLFIHSSHSLSITFLLRPQSGHTLPPD